MPHGCYGCSQIDFMRLTNSNNELETKHSYHAFIMLMCMMNIFVVCFLHASCSRMIQPLEVYRNWYMMWYLKKRYDLQGAYIFWLMHHFLNGLSIIRFLVSLAIIHQSGHRPSSTGHIPRGTRLCIPCTH